MTKEELSALVKERYLFYLESSKETKEEPALIVGPTEEDKQE